MTVSRIIILLTVFLLTYRLGSLKEKASAALLQRRLLISIFYELHCFFVFIVFFFSFFHFILDVIAIQIEFID